MSKACLPAALALGGVIFLAGCAFGESGESLYPLEEGLRWEYEMTSPAGSMLVSTSTMPTRSLLGKEVTPRRTEVAGQTVGFTFEGEGEDGFYTLGSQAPNQEGPELNIPPDYHIKRPVEVGTTWTSKKSTRVVEPGTPVSLVSKIESIDAVVTVPAGTFEGCVKISFEGQATKNMGPTALGTTAKIWVEGFEWYAPGVGLVRSIYKETSNHLLAGAGGEMSLQLKTRPSAVGQ